MKLQIQRSDTKTFPEKADSRFGQIQRNYKDPEMKITNTDTKADIRFD